jgi:hypothetical protein
VVDGRQVTAFHVKVPTRGSKEVTYSLRNTTNHPVRGRLYAATAAPDGQNGWTVGGAGSSRYVELPDQQTTLKPHETRLQTFRVHGKVEGTEHAAVVVEVKQGAVVTRAATLVYLERGRSVPLPLVIVGIAVLLLLAAGGAVAWVRRRPATQG